MKPKEKLVSPDKQLAHHINQAEDHLIKAVEIFAAEKRVERPTGYLTKLVRAQELVTGLNREELVRLRGFKRG